MHHVKTRQTSYNLSSFAVFHFYLPHQRACLIPKLDEVVGQLLNSRSRVSGLHVLAIMGEEDCLGRFANHDAFFALSKVCNVSSRID